MAFGPDGVEVSVQEQAQELEQQYHDEAIRWLLNDERGRYFVYNLLKSFGFQTSAFAAHDPQTNFNCGLRAAADAIFNTVMQAEPEAWLRMVREHEQRKQMFETRAENLGVAN